MNTLGNLIKELRVSRNLTQMELAHLAQVPFATINKLEQGKANVTITTLEKVLKVFGHELTTKKSSEKSSETL